MTCKHGDVLQLGPELGDGTHVAMRHTANHDIEVARARVVRAGENLQGSRVIIGRTHGDHVHVESELDLRAGGESETDLSHSGPAQVATPAYRDGWDRVFGPN